MDETRFSAGYVCGALCSSGMVVWNEKHSNYAISLETKNRELADTFYSRLKSLVEKEPRIGTHKRKSPGGDIHMNIVTLYGRKSVQAFTEKWGLARGNPWVVPETAKTDVDFRVGFITGFFDGSGSVYSGVYDDGMKKTKRRSVRIYSTNEKGVNGLRDLLGMEGIKSLLYMSGECFTIGINGKTRLQAFRNRIGFSISDKRRKLDEALTPLSVSGNEAVM